MCRLLTFNDYIFPVQKQIFMIPFLVVAVLALGYYLIDRLIKRKVKRTAWRVVVTLALLSVTSLIVLAATLIIYTVFALRYKQEDFNFNQQQMAFINAYKANDTLCFIDGKGIVDTYIVAKIEHEQRKQPGVFLAPSAFNRIDVTLTHYNSDDNYSGFSIITQPQSEIRLFEIRYKNFWYSEGGLGELHKDTLVINSKKITDYYLFRYNYLATAKPSDIIKVYWNMKEGMVAYETLDNGFWVKSTVQ